MEWTCENCGRKNSAQFDRCILCRQEPGLTGMFRLNEGLVRLQDRYGAFPNPSFIGFQRPPSAWSKAEIDEWLADFERDLIELHQEDAA
ncbi:MAG: hypothetical protein ACK47B_23560 [Armatimonadota bacterium]